MTTQASGSAAALLRADRTVLLVIDLQDRLMPTIAQREAIERNAELLLKLAEVMDLPVLATTQYRKGLGGLVPEVGASIPAASIVDKLSFSCFGSEEFLKRLSAFGGRDQLLVCGVETHVCVCQTALGALERGYTVHVASDAVGTRAEANQRVGLARMERAGAVLSCTEMAVFELLGRSGTDAFKRILPLIKG